MRFALTRVASALLIASLGLPMSTATTQAQTLNYAGQWNWNNMSQAQCVERAVMAINATGDRFSMPLRAEAFDGWHAASDLGHTSVRIFCPADDHASATVASQTSERVLVVFDIDTIRDNLASRIRGFLLDCFYSDRCRATAAGGGGGGGDPDPPDPSVPCVGGFSYTVREQQAVDGKNDRGRGRVENLGQCLAECSEDDECRTAEFERNPTGRPMCNRGSDPRGIAASRAWDIYIKGAACQAETSIALPPPSDSRGRMTSWTVDHGPYEVQAGEITASPAGDGRTSYYIAPRELLGDWRGRSLISFEKKSWGGRYYGPDSYSAYGDVVIRNGAMTARFDIAADHSGEWKSFTAPLDTRQWSLSGGARSLSDVLANVTEFLIRAEYGSGTDYSALRAVTVR